MQISLKHMNAEQCWNVIADMHNDYHQNLKHHKYTYNQFVPNDKRMHKFMEIENPTHEQVKHYRDIFLNEIYNESDLNKYDETILNSVIPKMQMAIDGKIKPLVEKWGLKLPKQLDIVCAYGHGGSYCLDMPPYILFRVSDYPADRSPYAMFIHEFVHLLIEEPIIIKHNVPQDLKERIVDLICLETIGRPVQEWCKDSFANAYITPEVIRTDLAGAVKKMMEDYTAIKQQNTPDR
jgi:hypothetical protein